MSENNLRIALVIAVLMLASSASMGQECTALTTNSVADAVEYLNRRPNDEAAAACVQVAFRNIASATPQTSIPLLITYLAYRRPLHEAEGRGIFMHGNGPSVLYPAVHELYELGAIAEPALIHAIAQSKDGSRTETNNALYTLLLIHHGSVEQVIESLRSARKLSVDGASKTRLEAAAEDASKWCDERAQKACEDALTK